MSDGVVGMKHKTQAYHETRKRLQMLHKQRQTSTHLNGDHNSSQLANGYDNLDELVEFIESGEHDGETSSDPKKAAKKARQKQRKPQVMWMYGYPGHAAPHPQPYFNIPSYGPVQRPPAYPPQFGNPVPQVPDWETQARVEPRRRSPSPPVSSSAVSKSGSVAGMMEGYIKKQNQVGPAANGSKMVTIRRVMEPHSQDPTVTISMKGDTPDKDQLMFTLVNGQVIPSSEVLKSGVRKSDPVANSTPSEPEAKKKKRRKKKPKKKPISGETEADTEMEVELSLMSRSPTPDQEELVATEDKMKQQQQQQEYEDNEREIQMIDAEKPAEIEGPPVTPKPEYLKEDDEDDDRYEDAKETLDSCASSPLCAERTCNRVSCQENSESGSELEKIETKIDSLQKLLSSASLTEETQRDPASLALQIEEAHKALGAMAEKLRKFKQNSIPVSNSPCPSCTKTDSSEDEEPEDTNGEELLRKLKLPPDITITRIKNADGKKSYTFRSNHASVIPAENSVTIKPQEKFGRPFQESPPPPPGSQPVLGPGLSGPPWNKNVIVVNSHKESAHSGLPSHEGVAPAFGSRAPPATTYISAPRSAPGPMMPSFPAAQRKEANNQQMASGPSEASSQSWGPPPPAPPGGKHVAAWVYLPHADKDGKVASPGAVTAYPCFYPQVDPNSQGVTYTMGAVPGYGGGVDEKTVPIFPVASQPEPPSKQSSVEKPKDLPAKQQQQPQQQVAQQQQPQKKKGKNNKKNPQPDPGKKKDCLEHFRKQDHDGPRVPTPMSDALQMTSTTSGNPEPGATSAGKRKKKKTTGKKGTDIVSCDSVFVPKNVDLEDETLDETEKELEAFKRFCYASVPLDRKEKVNLNIKDIIMKKRSGENGASSSCSSKK
ncbi:unnamed protein product [Notodromas monacha]|uniref:FAM193 C-terminal domain-containing protein n=1 Tax=Notodromas monacha TaxID=399045 RepID=A0A7R9BLY7_9CRUS|nr:unnamed protein product [Notodromas monacha]CAG0917935.1 unnamed protein product [Notodromas monacha]